MDKNAIKKYAVWARRELISRVSQRAALYEITDKGYGDASADSVLGRVMSAEEKRQRQALIAQIREKGYEQVMEEIAYTWFNRFIALRFMEVNGYLPSRVRVFTDDENNFKPQILTEAINMELDGLDMEKVYALKNANDDDALFKYMLIVQCNALSSILPGMFQRISDYTELLFPDNLLREGSVIEQMISMIPEEDWKDAVQIIGWLYQYYNSEKKDDVFAALKKNVKITKENIPAATQLFTPDWIVRYMVENSLGRLWVEGHPNDELKSQWKYYLEEAEQEPEVQAQLAEIRKEYAALTPEQLKVIDPCMGSGHILVYMFDVLVKIYEAYGYSARDAVKSIVENNLYGLDIDDRAAQLAYFAVMMKARQYDRRFFSRGIQPHVYAIAESNHVDSFALEYFCNGDANLKKAMDTIISELHDAKEYGSILNVTPQDWDALYARFAEIKEDIHISREAALRELLPLVQTAQALAQKYDVVVTNPPYMAVSNAGAKVNDYVKKNFPDSKTDMFAVFIERCGQMAKKNGYQAMITQHTWMFIASYEKLREKLLARTVSTMLHFGARAFDEIAGEVVQTVAFIITNDFLENYRGTYFRLLNGNSEKEKEKSFFSKQDVYIACQKVFKAIPRTEYIYWVSPALLKAFATYKQVRDFYTVRNGLTTGDNNTFLRLWYEVSEQTMSYKWFPCNKGGSFRRWYGNRDYLINWENDGIALKNFKDEKTGKLRSTLRNIEYNFLPAIVVGHVVSGDLPFRYVDSGFISESAVNAILPTNEHGRLLFLLAVLNSKPCNYISAMLSPTLGVSPEDVLNIPIPTMNPEDVEHVVEKNIATSKEDWDSYETSWDFKRNPLAVSSIPAVFGAEYCGKYVTRLEDHYYAWKNECKERFENLQINEEELNRIFIDIYGLQDELTPDVADKDVTVHRVFDSKDDVPESMKGSNYVRTMRDEIVSLISYAVGCMFGRYSLDVDGLAYAGGEWDASKYKTIIPDSDNIIPICDDDYFDDDITGCFVKWVEAVYGKDTLEENLKFIADALSGKGTPREVIRSYFLNDFYADHLKTYQKRPIYWLFDSGKKNGFKCLIYMHRYQPDTIARIRTDYVHEQQGRYRTAIADLESRIANADTGSRVKLTKQLTKLQEQAEELRVYEEKIHHLADQMIRIDLDDGVKHNYAIFQDVLAKIK